MNKALNDWHAGIRRIPLHLITFGAFGALATWYGGWGGAVVLVAWRAWDEYVDYVQLRDSFAKAWVDLGSQVLPAAIVAIVHH
jgi:hypothetical protein